MTHHYAFDKGTDKLDGGAEGSAGRDA